MQSLLTCAKYHLEHKHHIFTEYFELCEKQTDRAIVEMERVDGAFDRGDPMITKRRGQKVGTGVGRGWMKASVFYIVRKRIVLGLKGVFGTVTW